MTLVAQEGLTDSSSKIQQFRDSSQWDSAIHYLEIAVEGYRHQEDWPKLFEARLRLNDIRIESLRFEEADSALAKLIVEARNKWPRGDLNIARVLDLQGKVALESGAYSAAVSRLQESLTIRRTLKLKDDATGLTYYRLGDAWRSQGMVDSAMYAYEKALKIRQNLFGEESEEVAAVWSNIAILYRIIGDYDKAMDIYQKSDSVIVKVFGPEHKRRGSILNGMAIIHAQSARYPQALDYFNQLLKIDLKTLSKDSPTLARTYTNLGILHELMGDLQAAQDFHKKSLAIKFKIFEPDNPNLIVDYQGLSVVLSHLGDVDQALLYRKQVVDMSKKAYDRSDPRLGTSYDMLANSLMNKGDFTGALEYLILAEQIFKKNGESLVELGPVYHSMASIFAAQNMHDSALTYGQKALATNMAFSDEHPHVAGNHGLIGNLFYKHEDFEAAAYHYGEALRINKNVYGEKHLEVANAYSRVGSVYAAEGRYEEALKQIQLGLLAASDTFEHLNFHNNPLPAQTLVPRTLATVLGEKGQVLKQYYQQTGDDEILKLAMATFARAIEMIDAAQFSYKSKGSVANLKEEFEPVYEHAISLAYMLFEKTKDDQYLERAFQFSEKNKAALLVAALNETRAKEFAGIPMDLQEQERTLKRNLGYYEQLLQEEREKIAETDLQNKIFNLKNQYDLLIENIEKNYPKYFQLKYGSSTITAGDVQNSLSNNELLVEYFLGQENLYAFVIGSTFLDFIKIEIGDEFMDGINALRIALTDGSGDVANLKMLSSRLYEVLVAPFQARLDGQHLTIISDNELGYIPFEVLVRVQVDGQPSDTHYLIEQHAVSYAYSATFRSQMTKERQSNKQVRYLAFAPNFNDRNDAGDPSEPDLLAYHDVVRGGLAELKGAQREVESLGSFFDGDFYQQLDAHESLFKSVGGNYEILHLATHAIIDDLNPLNSRLLFTIQGDSADDGNLHAWELFSLNLKADLAVLSACNTGFGKIQKGEGIQSLGRAFAYAGCPSRLMSLWPAQDASTADIMESFYKNLSMGLAKDQALRQAKLNYLENAAEFNQHPFYWAGFVLQGDPSPLILKQQWILWGLILCFTLLLLWLLFKKVFKDASQL